MRMLREVEKSSHRRISLKQVLGLHTEIWPLIAYVHASFPLQDSFAKCSPSWYDVHSMKASSANGDAWFEKLWDEYILQILK